MAPTQPAEPSPAAQRQARNSQLTTHNIYMKTKSLDNFHFRIRYLTDTRPIDKMCNTRPQLKQNQILNCHKPLPGRWRGDTCAVPAVQPSGIVAPSNIG